MEHTLNVLFLPGIHANRPSPHHHPENDTSYSVSTRSSSPLFTTAHHQSHLYEPGLAIPGLGLSLPSPLHFQLHIITRLSFNEQGRITHHRDFWDVKDLLGLVPGVSLAQWVGSRLAAHGLSMVIRLFGVRAGGRNPGVAVGSRPQAESLGVDVGRVPCELFYEEDKDESEHLEIEIPSPVAYGNHA